MTNQTANNGKTVAIVSYITWIGWVIALVLHDSNKTSLGAFHLRQSGFIYLCQIALSLVTTLFGWTGALGNMIRLVAGIAAIALFILLIIGLIAAVNEQEKRVPLIGDLAQNMLAGLR